MSVTLLICLTLYHEYVAAVIHFKIPAYKANL